MDAPIFVVGASRSGTNLVRALLNEHGALWISPETRALCAWLGLDYEPAMLGIPVVNSSYATSGETTGVPTAAVERWKTTLSPGEIAVIQSCCGGLMGPLGYAREPVPASYGTLTWAWATAPLAAARAAVINRDRLGKLSHAARRRAGAAFKREPLLPL